MPKPKILGGHEAAVKELTLVPGRPWAITVGDDDQIIVWDIDVGERVPYPKGRRAICIRCCISRRSLSGDRAGNGMVG